MVSRLERAWDWNNHFVPKTVGAGILGYLVSKYGAKAYWGRINRLPRKSLARRFAGRYTPHHYQMGSSMITIGTIGSLGRDKPAWYAPYMIGGGAGFIASDAEDFISQKDILFVHRDIADKFNFGSLNDKYNLVEYELPDWLPRRMKYDLIARLMRKIIAKPTYNKKFDKWIPGGKYHPDVIAQARSIIHHARIDGRNTLAVLRAIQIWMQRNITYVYDPRWIETLVHPYVLLKMRAGDCIANYEQIYTKEGIKKVGDLKVGDMVLSYHLAIKDYVYKPVTKVWEKGEHPVKRLYFRNGTYADFTDEHKLPMREYQQRSSYAEVMVKDIDLSRWWTRKIAVAKRIPYNVKDISWLNEDLCFIIGHYLAEGWSENYHVCTSGYECMEEIIPRLEINDIRFTESANSYGVPYLRFLKSPFKTFLTKFGNKAINKKIPEPIFHLPLHKIENILKGYCLGDGWIGERWGKKRIIYNTSSGQLAEDLCRLHLQIGRPLHKYLSINHGGLGNHPIWRLTEYAGSHFARDYGYYNGLSEVSISRIEDLGGTTQVRDFEIADTHIYFLKNGIMSFNCDDQTLLAASMGEALGVPMTCVMIAQRNPAIYNHVLSAGKLKTGELIPIETIKKYPVGKWPRFKRRGFIHLQ